MAAQDEPVERMMRAVALEVSAVEQRRSANGVSADVVTVTDEAALTAEDGLERGARATLRLQSPVGDLTARLLVRWSSSSTWVRADLVSSVLSTDGGQEIVADVRADLPNGLRRVQVRKDDAALLRSLTARLEQLRRAERRQLARALTLVGSGTPTRPGQDGATARAVLTHDRTWNDEQRQAVTQALGSEVTFVWGPPGTGKTKVVAAVLEGMYRRGLRVLFAAPTHVAIDQALLRVCERLEGEPAFSRGLVYRVGGPQLEELRRRYGSELDPGAAQDRASAQLRQRAAEVSAELTRVEQLLQSHTDLSNAEATLTSLDEERTRGTLDLAAAERARTSHTARVIDLTERIEVTTSGRGLRAAWNGMRIPGWQEEQERERAEAEAAAIVVERWTSDLARLGERERKARSVLRRSQAHLAGSTSTPEALQRTREALSEQSERLVLEQQQVVEAVRRAVRITASTVAAAVPGRGPREGYDVVVLDEAGMVNLPSVFCVAALASRQVVIAGDFRQLPAVVIADPDKMPKDDAEVLRSWYQRDVFTASGAADGIGTAGADRRLVALRTQYRMRSAIGKLVSEVAYRDAPLRPGRTDDGSSVPPSPTLTQPLVLVDTSVWKAQAATPWNPAHAAVVRELLRAWQRDGVLPARREPGTRPQSTLGVIAPYNAQVAALRTVAKERLGADVPGMVETIHRFQGSQRPIIVFDTVEGAQANGRVRRFFTGTGLSSNTCRLLNVATSRAQDHLVVIANLQVLDRGVPAAGEARRMLDHLTKHALQVPVTSLVPIRAAKDLANLAEEELTRPAFFPADEVDEAITWDVGRAQRRIDFFCPFVNVPATKEWAPRLQAAAARNVHVVVTTRPPNGQESDAKARRLLTDAGLTVHHRDGMHEKVVVVVDDVVWHGSKNLLAHTRSTDLMMRIVSADSAAEVLAILERAQPTKAATSWRPASPATRRIRPPDTPDRRYLSVPFAQKDQAKALGAHFDNSNKDWYVDLRTGPKWDPETFRRWAFPDEP